MNHFKIFIVFIISLNYSVYGQNYTGMIINERDQNPVEFVNIGVVGRNIGTISDENGKYSLLIDKKFENDTLKFSCIGFESFSIIVSNFIKLANKNIFLKEKIYELKEVIVSPKKFKEKILGYTSRSKAIRGGFKENKLGYECGVFLKIKKSAVINKLNFNVLDCSYDTLFYRINFYRVAGKMEFENILTKPIYFKIPKDKIKDKISIDLTSENIRVNGNCLVTIEHIKDLGNGYLWFSGSFPGRTYYRKTSQGNWESVPFGISINVEAKIEE